MSVSRRRSPICSRGCAGVPLARWLAGRAGLPPRAPVTVPVNALLGASSPDDLAREAVAALDCGFGTLKMKVGRDAALDGERLRAVRAALGPDAEIRIDANGAWSEQEAVACPRGARRSRRRPLRAAGRARPRGRCEPRAGAGRLPRPIAADESCASLDDLRALLDADAVDAVVVKPLRTGLAEALAMIGEAAARDVPCILTTTFDTGAGTALATHLAALLPEPRPACGLATLPLLAGDIVRGCPAPEAGALTLPDIARPRRRDLDEVALDRFATGPWEGVSA